MGQRGIYGLCQLIGKIICITASQTAVTTSDLMNRLSEVSMCLNLHLVPKNATIKGSIIKGKCDFVTSFGKKGLRIASQLCVGYLILDPVILSLMIDTGSQPSVVFFKMLCY